LLGDNGAVEGSPAQGVSARQGFGVLGKEGEKQGQVTLATCGLKVRHKDFLINSLRNNRIPRLIVYPSYALLPS
jgi:hypothetical protein